ncbi:hypothetical protein BESB_031170 [Besnoitia besnoiti]|uniref:Transmembrane protein n=1 Tax=Besnoitia besnoiti TaxID=94643 RepID=A0A2A9M6H7_BESBE|nr:hypothetical protein BESB_031170 [Besnoitia besnoiti]PFH31243.1 hypothetical protein BESB_031170 [Besnoitia besnoiti]
MDAFGGGRPRLSASSAMSSFFSSHDGRATCCSPPVPASHCFSLSGHDGRRELLSDAGKECETHVANHNTLWSEFFKSCCFKAPLKVVGSLYTACLVVGCIVGARLHLLGPTDAVLPAVLSLLSFLLSASCRSLLLTPPSEALRAVSESPALGSLAAPGFVLFLLLAGVSHLGAVAFALAPLRFLLDERRCFLHAFLILFACSVVFLHLYRHVAQCRFQLLLCPLKPGLAPILLGPFLRFAVLETFAGFLLSLPLFLLLFPGLSIFSSFHSPSTLFSAFGLSSASRASSFLDGLPDDGEDVSAFSASFALSRPLSFLASLLLIPLRLSFVSLEGATVCAASLSATALAQALVLFLLNVHGELQQQARASDCAAIAAFVGSMAASSLSPSLALSSASAAFSSAKPVACAADSRAASAPLRKFASFAPPATGRAFDEQCLLLRWLYDCGEALQSSIWTDSPSFSSLPPYSPVLSRSTALSSRSPFGTALWGRCPVCDPSFSRAGVQGPAAGAFASTRPWGSALDAGVGRAGGGAWQIQALLEGGKHGAAQREKCPLVPALAEWFSECADDFPLLPPSPQSALVLPCEGCQKGAWMATWQEARRRKKMTKWSDEEGREILLFTRREAATLVAQQMLHAGVVGTSAVRPNLVFSMYESLVFGLLTHFVRLLRSMQQVCLAASCPATLVSSGVNSGFSFSKNEAETQRAAVAAAAMVAAEASFPFPASRSAAISQQRAAAAAGAAASAAAQAACAAEKASAWKRSIVSAALAEKLRPFLPPVVFALLVGRDRAEACCGAPASDNKDEKAAQNGQRRLRSERDGGAQVNSAGGKPGCVVARVLGSLGSLVGGARSRPFAWLSADEKRRAEQGRWKHAQVELSVMLNCVACAVEGFALWLCAAAAVASKVAEGKESLARPEDSGDEELTSGASEPFVSLAVRDAAAGLVLNVLEILNQQQLLRRSARPHALADSPGRLGVLNPELLVAMEDLDRRTRRAVVLMCRYEPLKLRALAAGVGPAASLSPLMQTQLRKLLSSA